MLFNSYLFIFVFLPLTLAVFGIFRCFYGIRGGLAVIPATSLIFYGYWNPLFLLLLTGSMLMNHQAGFRISRAVGKRRRIWLAAAIVLNLGVLGYFKYWNFFISTMAAVFPFRPEFHSLVLPLGISFFTFQQIAFLADIHHGNIKSGSLLEYMAFVSFFPQLIAGPIVRYQDLHQQFRAREWLSWNSGFFLTGLCLFSLGLFKKTVLADRLSLFVGPVFDAGARGDVLLPMDVRTATLAYTFQLYFDFSGYADMALGLGAMMGIRLPENFNSPYKAGNFIEFWQRWHISLSRFLRDYLYIPLGGSRCGPRRRYTNLMITMLLCGLWHGAGVQFIFWGGLHGLLLMLNHMAVSRFPAFRLPRPMGGIITFMGVALLWTAFRAKDMGTAMYLYKTLFDFTGFPGSMPGIFSGFDLKAAVLAGPGSAPYWLILSGLIVWGLPTGLSWCRWTDGGIQSLSGFRGGLRAFVAGILFFISLKVLAGSGSSEFLYFNF